MSVETYTPMAGEIAAFLFCMTVFVVALGASYLVTVISTAASDAAKRRRHIMNTNQQLRHFGLNAPASAPRIPYLGAMRVTLINGAAGVGKDTFVDFCSGGPFGVTNVSTVDQVKTAAGLLGWDGEKDEKGRQFLSDLKDLSTRVYDGPLNYALDNIEEALDEGDCDHVFIHVREPAEITKLVAEVPQAETLLITRTGVPEYGNHADASVENYPYNRTIDNNGTLADLWKAACEYMTRRM